MEHPHTLIEKGKLYDEAVEALKGAMRIVDLWSPNYSKDQINESEIGELAALSMMRKSFEETLEKHANL